MAAEQGLQSSGLLASVPYEAQSSLGLLVVDLHIKQGAHGIVHLTHQSQSKPTPQRPPAWFHQGLPPVSVRAWRSARAFRTPRPMASVERVAPVIFRISRNGSSGAVRFLPRYCARNRGARTSPPYGSR